MRRLQGLAFGRQKRVEIARALTPSPKTLLLDEPAGGLNSAEVAGLPELHLAVMSPRASTLMVLLVEHHI